MVINAIKCSYCGDIIFSRVRHDFRPCSCGRCFIDGGSFIVGGYLRYGGKFESIKLDLNKYYPKLISITSDDKNLIAEWMGRDWDSRTDKYGLIKNTFKRIMGEAIEKGQKRNRT
jgi:hypothetical protein